MSKIALLIGINYHGTSAELSGCINDINNVKKVLMKVYNYKEENIDCLTDDTTTKPTKGNIIAKFNELIYRSNNENVSEIWIHYSGHGSYMKDNNGDEKDQQDECLVPLDYNKSGLIRDDVVNKTLDGISKDVHVIAVVDACHSETMFDLPYKYISGTKHVIENTDNKIISNCIMISGCKDNQTSADAYNINNSREFSGAMTTALLATLKKYRYTVPCWVLLRDMRKFLSLRKFTQIPQITCSEKLAAGTLFSCVNPRPYVGLINDE
jgi:hypothetical protein